MKIRKKILTLFLCTTLAFSFSSCQVQKTTTEAVTKTTAKTTKEEVAEKTTKEETTTAEVTTTTAVKVVEDYAASKVNEQGHVMVVMYHGIMDNPPYHRTKEQFLKDLQYMYDHNYRLISLEEYLSGHITVEGGMTPILLTFDDGLDTTFALKKTADGFDVDENTAIGILEGFLKEHPDFGRHSVLYFHDQTKNFGEVGTDKDRFDWLLEHGYEFGNHTATHDNLGKLSKENVIKEVGRVEKYVRSLYPNMKLTTITYPFGARPNEAYRDAAVKGEYDGVKYDYVVGFREGPSGPFVPVTHNKFQPFNAPRVRGSDGANGDLWWYFDYYEKNPSLKYVSDGNPNTLVVPEKRANTINDYAKENFEVITY